MKECTVASKVVRNLLDKLKVHCNMCKNVVNRGELKDHQEKYCPLFEAYVEVEKKKQELDQLYQSKVDELMNQNEQFILGEKEKLEQERVKMLQELEEKDERNQEILRSQREALEMDRKLIQHEKTSRYQLELSNKPIHLNVEGTVMTVALSHFMVCPWEPNNLFKKMFSGEHPLYETPTSTFQDTVFFIDCQLKVFEAMLGWLRFGCFEDYFDETIKYKLIHSCLLFDLENLTAIVRKKYFNNDRIAVSQSFKSIVERSRGTGLRFNGLNFQGFSFGDMELTECKVTDCDLSNLVSGNKWLKCTFTQCTFSNPKLVIRFTDCVFNNCTFTNSIIETGSGCSLIDCKMNEMELVIQDFATDDKRQIVESSVQAVTKLVLNNVRLSGSKISGAKGKVDVKMVGCDFTNNIIDVGCNAIKCNLTLSKFSFGSVFTHCKMDGIDFSARDLTEFEFMCCSKESTFQNARWEDCQNNNFPTVTFRNVI